MYGKLSGVAVWPGRRPPGLTVALLLAGWLGLGAVPDTASAQVPEPLQVGDEAPDFTLPGATRYGVLAEPVSLRDYAGKTVVLSFFFRARTKG